MPATPGTPQLTISALLNQPPLVSRALVNLVYKRLIADRLFVRGTSDQVAGGAMRYQSLESIFVDDDPELLEEGSDFPITDWSETVSTAPVKGYGFGIRVTNLMMRRHQLDMVIRGQRKLANRLVKYIDTQAMNTLNDTGNASIQTSAASAHWATASTDIVGDITAAQYLLESKDNGYQGFEGATLVLNTTHRNSLLNNTALRALLPRENFAGPNLIQSGDIGGDVEFTAGLESGFSVPFLGLSQILFTPQLASTTGILMDTSIAGTIADELPDGSEGFVAYDPGPGFAPIYVKVEPSGRPGVHRDVFAGRWPAIALVQPDAVVRITGIA